MADDILFSWGNPGDKTDVWQTRGAESGIQAQPLRARMDSHSGFMANESIEPPMAFSVETVFFTQRLNGNLQIITTALMNYKNDEDAPPGDKRLWCLEVRGEGERLGPPGFLSIAVRGADGNWRKSYSETRISEGWHHVVTGFDGTRTYLYLDSVPQDREMRGASATCTEGRLNPPELVSVTPVLGDASGRVGNGIDGEVALLRIRSGTPDQAEVTAWREAALAQVPELQAVPAPRQRPAKAPFKVLFSNDFTNLGIVSPYHPSGAPFERSDLRESVLETKGADVHMLQPAHGQVPWWPSKIYPLEEHHAWWAKHYGVPLEKQQIPAQHREIMAGWDPYADFFAACTEAGEVGFISLRLNDTHHTVQADTPGLNTAYHAFGRFYVEHPEYRLGPAGSGLDWAYPEVPARMLAFIRELCERYNPVGFELDFMRFPNFFRPEFPYEKRVAIVTDFVAQASACLGNRGEYAGKHWLCARVPSRLEKQKDVGIYLPKLVDAGLDMVNLSCSYFTGPYSDTREVRELIPDATVYVELCHTTLTGKAVSRRGGDNFTFLRTTDEQYYTAAHLAYEEGADGISLFNFVYTREHGARPEERGPWNEPPFHVLANLGKPQWLAQQPQWYVLANIWSETPFPKNGNPMEPVVCRLDMSPRSGRKEDGLLRLLSKNVRGLDDPWTVLLNGKVLEPSPSKEPPIATPYECNRNLAAEIWAYRVPHGLPRKGTNYVVIVPKNEPKVDLDYLDVILP